MKTENTRNFKVGEKVYVISPRGEKVGRYTIKGFRDTVVGITMFSFNETDISVGEFWLKRKMTDRTLKISECMVKAPAAVELRMQDIDEAVNNARMDANESGESIDIEELGKNMQSTRMPANGIGLIFFRPNSTFVEWLKDYIGNRMVIEVGCGSGKLITKLADMGLSCCGFDPQLAIEDYAALNTNRIKQGKNLIYLFPQRAEEVPALFESTTPEKHIVIFARPCHSNFVETTIDMLPSGVECLYITMPKNLERYDDLGKYGGLLKELQHKGSSPDNEKVYSITKQ